MSSDSSIICFRVVLALNGMSTIIGGACLELRKASRLPPLPSIESLRSLSWKFLVLSLNSSYIFEFSILRRGWVGMLC